MFEVFGLGMLYDTKCHLYSCLNGNLMLSYSSVLMMTVIMAVMIIIVALQQHATGDEIHRFGIMRKRKKKKRVESAKER